VVAAVLARKAASFPAKEALSAQPKPITSVYPGSEHQPRAAGVAPVDTRAQKAQRTIKSATYSTQRPDGRSWPFVDSPVGPRLGETASGAIE
jgi:hypothetical protein